MSEHNSFEGFEADGISPMMERTPTVLVLDTSGSMSEETSTPDGAVKPKITQLNEGLKAFHSVVSEKEHANKRVDVAVITFGGSVTVQQNFVPVQEWTPATLTEAGQTPMGEALTKATHLVEDRKRFYKDNGIQYNRPLVWLLTDGMPTDMEPGDPLWNDVQEELERGRDQNRFEVFSMGVGEADMEVLNELVRDATGRPALKIKEGMFQEYFQFMSKSLETASNPDSGDAYELDATKLEDFVQVE